MITKVPPSGSRPLRLIDYLLRRKPEHSRLLATNLTGDQPREWARQLQIVNQTFRPRKTQFVKHLILSFPSGENLPHDDLQSIVRLYLERMGYAEAPFLAAVHTDTQHHHVHIVTTPTTWDGKIISESYDWPRSVRAAREIEEKWGLTPVPSPGDTPDRQPSTGELRKAARDGQRPAREVFQQEISDAAWASHNLEELVLRLEKEGFQVRLRHSESQGLQGISFGRNGLRFSGSQLGPDFTGPNLSFAFGVDCSVLPRANDERARKEVAMKSPHLVAVPPPDPTEITDARDRERFYNSILDKARQSLHERVLTEPATEFDGTRWHRMDLSPEAMAATRNVFDDPLGPQSALLAKPDTSEMVMVTGHQSDDGQSSSLRVVTRASELRERNLWLDQLAELEAYPHHTPRFFQERINASVDIQQQEHAQSRGGQRERDSHTDPNPSQQSVVPAEQVPPKDGQEPGLPHRHSSQPGRPTMVNDSAPTATKPPLSLPRGRYDLAAVRPEQIQGNDQHIPYGELGSIRKQLSVGGIHRQASRIFRDEPHKAVIIRPTSDKATLLGFRNLSRHQVEALRRGGFEPALLVEHSSQASQGQAGAQQESRYDLVLRAHTRLSEKQAQELRTHLESHYNLPVQRGVFVDAVRYPGNSPSQRAAAQLVEVQDSPFSASHRVVEQLYTQSEGQEIERFVIHAPNTSADGIPGKEPRVQSAFKDVDAPNGTPFARLYEEVVQPSRGATSLANPALAKLSDRELIEAAWEANSQVIGELERDPEADLTQSSAARELRTFESEIHHRAERIEALLREKHERLADLSKQVESLTPRSGLELGTPQQLEWQEVSRASEVARMDLEQQSTSLMELRLGQITLDGERYAHALAWSPRPDLERTHLDLVTREIDLRTSLDAWAAIPPHDAASEARTMQAQLAFRKEAAQRAFESLRTNGLSALDVYETARRSEIVTEKLLERAHRWQGVDDSLAELRLRSEPSSEGPEPPQAVGPQQNVAGVEPGESKTDVETILSHKEALSRLAAGDPPRIAAAIERNEALSPLQHSAARIALGDFSPENLRYLNGQIVLHGPAKLPLPSLIPPSKPQALVNEYLKLRTRINVLAMAVAQSRNPNPRHLQHLFYTSARAIAIHQQFEKIQRSLLQIAEPGSPPKGIAKGAWQSAWLYRAAQKGLSGAQASTHLLNAGLAPLPALPAGPLITSGLFAARQAAHMGLSWGKRVLQQ